MNIKIASDFSRTPGGRYIKDGPFSGELFRNDILIPKFDEAVQSGDSLIIDLDGGYGYFDSFKEEAFGGLARVRDISIVLKTIVLKSDDDPELIGEINGYIVNARKKK